MSDIDGYSHFGSEFRYPTKAGVPPEQPIDEGSLLRVPETPPALAAVRRTWSVWTADLDRDAPAG